MLQLIILLAQIGLAFYIISSMYLVMVYYLRNSSAFYERTQTNVDAYFENHINIVFNNYVDEENLIRQVQFLQQQAYRNFTAYFFATDKLITLNNFDNIKVICLNEKQHTPYGLVDLAKKYFDSKPDAILVVNSNSLLHPELLHKLNAKLLEGANAIQCQIVVETEAGESAGYQQLAKRFFNLIDRDAMQANGLSSAIWNQGFLLRYAIFESLNFSLFKHNDKALQAELIAHSVHIDYEPSAKIIERPMNTEELLESKATNYAYYFFNLRLGFHLLLEGFKNPSMDKIIFGFNYLRPPLWIMLLSSISLVSIELIYQLEIALFFWIALIGILISSLLLIRPGKKLEYELG